MSDWQIRLAQMPLNIPLASNAAGHNYLALFDGNGNQVSELNGLATASSGKIREIGFMPGDDIKVYEDYHRFYSSGHVQETLYSGSQQDVMAHWQAARAAADAIDIEDINYSFLGIGFLGKMHNSNSAASTLIAAMNFDEPDLDGTWFTPGSGKMLLDSTIIDFIQSNYLGSNNTYHNYDQMHDQAFYEAYLDDPDYYHAYAAEAYRMDQEGTEYYWDTYSYYVDPYLNYWQYTPSYGMNPWPSYGYTCWA